MSGAGGGTGKGGMSKAATDALGKLTRHDNRGVTAPLGMRRGLLALALVVLVLAGWGVWELAG